MFNFVGDAGIDHYTVENLKTLGGCSLNVATHFKRNSGDKATLFYPSIIENQIREHCQKVGIEAFPLLRTGKVPTQHIEHDSQGEKKFTLYEPGVIENFQFSPEECSQLKTIEGALVIPLYSQILFFVDQVISIHPGPFYFDFHDAVDFKKDFNQIRPYLERAHFAQFGLSQTEKDNELKELLLNYAYNEKIQLLITSSHHEILYFDTQELHQFKPIKLERIVDSTGAGDAFLGAFLASLSKKIPPRESLEQASLYTHKVLLKKGSL
ncbi:MAG: hypothetical protein CME60_11925 [Halobacteriovoraceae bacterium]|nr:hypothetical protein [Halobacteriovoraceae bacterium]|tara:strand:- start:36857 stop:37657 length:801 start_codon:yes stop_codon:yes gene_type:complete